MLLGPVSTDYSETAGHPYCSMTPARPAAKMTAMPRSIIPVSLLICATSFAQGPENVLLVVNAKSKVSPAVAMYYLRRRHVPASQICTIHAPDDDEVDRTTFDKRIRLPIMECLKRGNLQDRILYIVLTKGVPLGIQGSDGRASDRASVDSELALVYQDLLGVQHPLPGKIPNPYFVRHATGNFVRFSHREFAMYLVTRLDGYDLEDIRALIDRALAPSREGRFILDEEYDDSKAGNVWLREAAQNLQVVGVPESRIVLEQTTKFLTGEKDVLGYASWGSNDHANHSRFIGNTWKNGALLDEFVSTDARTFERPPKGWTIGQWSDPPETMFKGSPQSLIADYIHEGVTGAAGHVYEPYLDACIRPQILFPAYVRGLNLAESYYAAMPYLSWMTIVVGDPLTAPFPAPPLASEEADPPRDAASGLPLFFAKRLAKRHASR